MGGEKGTHLAHGKNLLVSREYLDEQLALLARSMHVLERGETPCSRGYRGKGAVVVDGDTPKTFASEADLRAHFERSRAARDEGFDDDGTFIYAGTPCSFIPVQPFVLSDAPNQNVLVAGGDAARTAAVVTSITQSWSCTGAPIELWASARNALYKRYGKQVWAGLPTIATPEALVARVRELKAQVLARRYEPRLIVCLGLDQLLEDLEVFAFVPEASMPGAPAPAPASHFTSIADVEDELNQIAHALQAATSEQERVELRAQGQALARQVSASARAQATASGVPLTRQPEILSAETLAADLRWLMKAAPLMSIHFVVAAPEVASFMALKAEPALFTHKLLFALSKDDSFALTHSARFLAEDRAPGTVTYTDGKVVRTLRPHIWPGIAFGRWSVDGKGSVHEDAFDDELW